MSKVKDVALDYTTESSYAVHWKCGARTLFVWQEFHSIAEKDSKGNFLEKTQNYVNVCDGCGEKITDSDIRDSERNFVTKAKRVKTPEPPEIFDITDDNIFTKQTF